MKDSYKENGILIKCRFVWDSHTHSVDGFVMKEEFGMTFNLMLVKWDIEIHASTLQKEKLIKIRPLEWDSNIFQIKLKLDHIVCDTNLLPSLTLQKRHRSRNISRRQLMTRSFSGLSILFSFFSVAPQYHYLNLFDTPLSRRVGHTYTQHYSMDLQEICVIFLLLL